MTKLKIEGMTCEHCQKAVQSALQSVDGVQTASVDLDQGFAEVDGSVATSELIHAVKEEGYRASPLPE